MLDVWNAYHFVPIRAEDKDKTTFITPWGHYRYLWAPQGYLASGDGFTHRDQLTSQAVKNKVTLVDDNMVWDATVEENFVSVCKLLDIYGKAGLVMNSDKFQFGKETVNFAGMEITKDAIRPAREYLDAIRNFPVPKTISSMRSFYGMINQVNYAFLMSEHMEPFRHLLKSDTPYCWSPILKEKFEMAMDGPDYMSRHSGEHIDTGHLS